MDEQSNRNIVFDFPPQPSSGWCCNRPVYSEHALRSHGIAMAHAAVCAYKVGLRQVLELLAAEQAARMVDDMPLSRRIGEAQALIRTATGQDKQ